MKLLHVIGSMDPVSGGPCQGIRNSNRELQKFGVEREAVSLDPPQADFLGSDDFPTHALGPIYTPWKYSARLMPWLVENICYFDVVIVNGLWLFTSFAVWRAIQKVKRDPDNRRAIPKVFVMPHGMLDPYFQRTASRRLKAVRNWLYWHLIEKHVVNDAEAILFTCEREMQLARETFSGYQPKKEINVGYGIVPPPAFKSQMAVAFRQKCPEVNNRPYLLFLSRIHPKKGIDLLLEAYAKVLQTNNDVNVSIPALVIAGPDEIAFAKKIKQQVAGNPLLKENVFFAGMLQGDAKWGALYGCEAFTLPSHQENFGIAIVEAMACIKPVLITDQINIYLEIERGGGGLVAHDDLEGITRLLQRWLAMPDSEKKIMGENAAKVFSSKFDIKSSSSAFLKAISPAQNF